MVVHAFPVAKLAALLVKQISKPIANAVKQGAKSSPVFRKYVCLPPAQFYNWCEVKAKMWLLHLGQPVNITVLNEAASIELGANLLGESVIFTIAAVILLMEYNRGTKKEAAKEEARKNEMQQLRDSVRDLFIQTEEQGAHIRELTRKIGDLETGIIQGSRFRPTTNESPERKPPPDEPPSIPPNVNHPSSLKEGKIENADIVESSKYMPFRGVVFRALNNVENEFFIDTSRGREPGILTVALNMLYRDVYRSTVTF